MLRAVAGSAGGGLGITALTGDVMASGPGSATASLAWISRSAAQTLNIGAGGTLGSNAFTSTAYAPIASPTFTGTATMPDGTTFGANMAIGGNAIVTGPSAAKHQFGAADAASPVAQTLQFQNGSGSNIAAVNATIIAPLATGNATNGDFIFKTGVKTTSGSGAPTQTTALTIKGETQLVQSVAGITLNGNLLLSTDRNGDIGADGANRFNNAFFGGTVVAKQATAITAGGVIAIQIGPNAAFIGIYYGSGVPTTSAKKGSLYLRSDGSTVNDRMYVNTDGGTTWTAMTTAS